MGMRQKPGTICLLAAVVVAAMLQPACTSTQARSTDSAGNPPGLASEATREPGRTGWSLPWSKPKPIDVVIPAGASLRVTLNHAITTSANKPGDRFSGAMADPVLVDGRAVIPRGALVEGVVRTASPSGRLKGRAVLSVTLDRVSWDGQSYQIATSSVTRTSAGHKKRNWTLIGGGSGAGALIGALAGGGTGAAIGAGAGAAAGTAGAALTGRRHVAIPSEAVLSFRTTEAARVKYTPPRAAEAS